MRTKRDRNGDDSGPRRYQIKAHVSLITHEKFRVYSEAQKRSMQRAAEALIEETVKDVKLEPFPVPPAEAPRPAPVIRTAYPMTPEQKKAYDESRAKLRAQFNPEEQYLHWRHRGCTRERATQIVDEACRNWELTWAGVTPELEARVRSPRPQPEVSQETQKKDDGLPDASGALP